MYSTFEATVAAARIAWRHAVAGSQSSPNSRSSWVRPRASGLRKKAQEGQLGQDRQEGKIAGAAFSQAVADVAAVLGEDAPSDEKGTGLAFAKRLIRSGLAQLAD